MAYFFRNLIFPAALGLASLLLSARGAATPEIELRFTVFSEVVPAGLEYAPSDARNFTPLIFYSAHRSPIYSYRGAPLLKFYNLGNHTATAAEFAVPEGLHRALLLLVPSPGTSGNANQTFSVIGVDDSIERIPSGQFAILNLSGREYEGRYGKQTISVPKGLGRALPSASNKYLKLIADLDGSAVAVGGLQFGLQAGQRAIVVIFPPVQKTSVQPVIRALYEESANPEEAPSKRKREK